MMDYVLGCRFGCVVYSAACEHKVCIIHITSTVYANAHFTVDYSATIAIDPRRGKSGDGAAGGVSFVVCCAGLAGGEPVESERTN